MKKPFFTFLLLLTLIFSCDETKTNLYKKNDRMRRLVARNGQKKYFQLFNEVEVAKYIVNESIGITNYKPKAHWSCIVGDSICDSSYNHFGTKGKNFEPLLTRQSC